VQTVTVVSEPQTEKNSEPKKGKSKSKKSVAHSLRERRKEKTITTKHLRSSRPMKCVSKGKTIPAEPVPSIRPGTRYEFDRWLASVNELINASMNYKLDGEPKPLVYYVPQVSRS